jgi:hypothetical protein
MQVSTGSARKRAWNCAVMVAGVAGLVAGLDPSAAQTKDPSPAQVVAYRFPAAWKNAAAVPASSATAATKQQAAHMFDPNPTYSLASASSRPALPESALAYADVRETTAARTAPAPDANVKTAALPEQRSAPSVRNPVLLNDSQLASIKQRLHLSADQQQYWPQVEAALRAISRHIARIQAATKPGKDVHAKVPNLDPDSPEVQQLKAAAIPLLMTMREDQKREVRALARLIGLNAVASQI